MLLDRGKRFCQINERTLRGACLRKICYLPSKILQVQWACKGTSNIALSSKPLISIWSRYNSACSVGSEVLKYWGIWGMTTVSRRTVVRNSIVNSKLYPTGLGALTTFYFSESSFTWATRSSIFSRSSWGTPSEPWDTTPIWEACLVFNIWWRSS